MKTLSNTNFNYAGKERWLMAEQKVSDQKGYGVGVVAGLVIGALLFMLTVKLI